MVSLLFAIVVGQSASKVLPADIDRLVDKPWVGKLTYLDYSSGKRTTLETSLAVTRVEGKPSSWKFAIGYPGEPKANGSSLVSISVDGRQFDGETVSERKRLKVGALRIVTDRDGEDDGKPAHIRHVYLVSDTAFSIQKLVRFNGAKNFLERNRYRWIVASKRKSEEERF